MSKMWHSLKWSNRLNLLYWGSSCGPLIRKIIAASSLNRAIQSLSYSTRQKYRQHILAFHELSVNPRAVDKAKTVQYHLKRSFREVREVLLWQDVVNNSISPHRSNKFMHLTPLKKIGILKVWVLEWNFLTALGRELRTYLKCLTNQASQLSRLSSTCYLRFSVFVRSIGKLLRNSKHQPLSTRK